MPAAYAEPGVPDVVTCALTMIAEQDADPAPLARILHGLGYGAGLDDVELATRLSDVAEYLRRRDTLLLDPTSVTEFNPEDDDRIIGSLWQAGVDLAEHYDGQARDWLAQVVRTVAA